MPTEQCDVCGDVVAFAQTVHVLVHTHTDAGVVDRYVCTGCYDADVAPALDAPVLDAAGRAPDR